METGRQDTARPSRRRPADAMPPKRLVRGAEVEQQRRPPGAVDAGPRPSSKRTTDASATRGAPGPGPATTAAPSLLDRDGLSRVGASDRARRHRELVVRVHGDALDAEAPEADVLVAICQFA